MCIRHYSFLVLIVCITSCELFTKKEQGIPIARVNDSFLYKDDIKDLVQENTSKEDSILRINNYIDQWATQQLLINGAKMNLGQETQNEFDVLIQQYEVDLYTKAYMEALVKQNIDTTITFEEAKVVYESNLESFKLNEDLIKFRYINVDENNSDVKDIEERLKRFDNEDKRILDSISIQFKSYSLNDSIWIKVNQAVEKNSCAQS